MRMLTVTMSSRNQPLRSTHLGHPSVDKHNQ